MVYLRSVSLSAREGAYPFNSPALTALERIDFAPVTIVVGENGSGKSTLLEALARLMRLPALGAADAGEDATLSAVQPLCDAMRPVFSRRPRTGMFLRAEDFFGYTRRISALEAEMRAELRRVEEEYADASAFTRGQARMAFAGSLYELERVHGRDPDARSHGESFVHMFAERIHDGGLYILDEPEAPLSPLRQLALIELIMKREEGSQFIIATHSPMLMAYPGAALWSFDEAPARRVEYGELESVRLIRDFLNAPARYMSRLREE
ncbi:MAG: AAA family ATPase [Candidatus Fimadaptatus sp.]